jgi:glycosyltransferase involved in cell wall biosynthesis
MAPDLHLLRDGLVTESDARRTAAEIKKLGVRKLIFVISDPHPYFLLSRLGGTLEQIEEICFHVYGDFSFFTPEWVDLLQLIKNVKVKFVVGSFAQKKLVDNFLGPKKNNMVDVVPFPASIHKTPVSLKNRISSRRRFGIEEDDFVLIYAGRISQEKNSSLLVEFISNFVERNPSVGAKIKVLFAGGFEDSNHYFLNQYFSEDGFLRLWQDWFQKFPLSIREKFKFLGFLKKRELSRFYAAGDLFVSLSTFHDEDFGLAPAEALAAGCPAVLTAWGGYSTLAADGRSVGLVPVRLSKKGLEIDYIQFEKHLLSFYKKRQSQKIRRHVAEQFEKNFGKEIILQAYRRIHGAHFEVFTGSKKNLYLHAAKSKRMREGRGRVFSSYSTNDILYRKIYRAYLHVES